MAGTGSRFSNAGYLLPKPLITVSGKPMITQVINCLPPAEKSIFVLRKDHVDDFKIDSVIRESLPQAEMIILEESTTGQATSCKIGLTNVADNEEVLISACDNGFLYDKEKFRALRQRDDVDCIVWTFTKDNILTADPEAWGWIALNPDEETVDGVSVKTPVSADPYNDHAVVATFWFRRAGDFRAAYKLMVEEDYKINEEFYVDAIPVFLKRLGKKSVIFPVELYVGWGKPADLHLYELREHEHKIGRDTTDSWRKYFTD